MRNEQDRTAMRYRALAEWHHSLFSNHPDGVFELDLQGRFQRTNAALCQITGYSNAHLIGQHFNGFIDAGCRQRVQNHFDTARQGGACQYEALGLHRDGHAYPLEIINFPVTIDGSVVGVYGICRDITARQQAETLRRQQAAQIAYQANHDLLTGLPNRSAFEESLQTAFVGTQAAQKLLVVMLLDLDGFKAVNDGLSYHIGNQMLVAIGERLRRVAGSSAMLARMAGDEFAVLCTSCADCDAAIELAEQILAAVLQPLRIEGRTLYISASIGMACNCEPVAYAQELLQWADLALTDAKQQGRNTWHWYQGNRRYATESSVMLRNDLYTALAQEQFELYYQPIVETATGRVYAWEALIRWHHPTRGTVSPGIFIPLAEQTGQIIPLGQWVLRQACQEAAALHARGGCVTPVAVNISSLQFRRPDFLTNLQAALNASGLAPAQLELEITESVLLHDADTAIALLETLREMGIRVALDDFGTGFSSLSYLRDLPIYKVKIDRAFLQDLQTDNRNVAIVEGIITMAHHLGLKVVAEGIETRAQQQDLIRRHCDWLQGYYFARPMPLADALALPERLPLRGR